MPPTRPLRDSPTRMSERPSPIERLLAPPGAARIAQRVRSRGAGFRGLLREFAPAPTLGESPPLLPDRTAGELCVASWNLHKCVGADGRFDPARSVAVIAELDADIVALQEADKRFGRRSGLLDLHALERATGLAPLHVSDLADGHGWHGNALLVRRGTHARFRRLALPGAEPRGALVAELALAEGPLRVVAAHLGLLRRCRTRQIETILRILHESPPMPTLLLGDLNEWRPGARSSLRALEPVFGPVPPAPPSFPARLPLLPLDRILGWPHGLVSDVRVHRSRQAAHASDHLPLTARVRLGAAARAEALSQAA
ncbi:MAG: endonuclease/exonuclease/phosphatase family protein [Rubritepida sp.]|nr:endonuclease/exonuclease/phosphatase family protein [Rubritepida sp.]